MYYVLENCRHIFQILTYSSLNIYEVDKYVNNCINANKTRRNCTFDFEIGYEDPLYCVLYYYRHFFQIWTSYSSLNMYEVEKYVNNCINANKTRINSLFDLQISMRIPCIVYFITIGILLGALRIKSPCAPTGLLGYREKEPAN